MLNQVLPEILRDIVSRNGVCTVLDLGSGRGYWGFMLNEFFRFSLDVIGVDIFLPHVEFSSRLGVYYDVTRADVRHLPFRNKSVDMVLMIEVLEHLSKEEGVGVLNKIEKIAKKAVVITTPNGWWPQTGAGNPFGAHRSSWTAKELKEMKYVIVGVGFRGLRSLELGNSGFRQSLFIYIRNILHAILGPLSKRIPSTGDLLLAYKFINPT